MAAARELDLDLVEVDPQGSPPVCRIMDYGKFKFDTAQKAREQRRRSSSGGIKEMKYRPKIGAGDFDTKTRQVVRFLSDGNKVKVTIMFRGREVNHPELGRAILDRVAERVVEAGKVESQARLDGKNMVMVLAPERRPKSRATPAGRDASARGRSAGSSPTAGAESEADAVTAPAPAGTTAALDSPGVATLPVSDLPSPEESVAVES
jgi:translation initiation factor IF-3